MSISRSRHPDPESEPDPADPALDQGIKKRRVRTGESHRTTSAADRRRPTMPRADESAQAA
ncbi:hypothetical protein EHS25_001331 [Saitozyma podzolica]|uniref:Uncharacterized protein n=1 Tax=Saitozyma podzolica TaxID=1890683 RepID=A0A427YFX4_9TREE|nr:hypothetical protein EHS25_001331 [Saitozyma podzolica]